MAQVVCYIRRDTLYSDLLEEGTYMAYSSLSKTVIQLIPSRCGDYYCHDGIMQIDGLDEIAGGNSGCLLPHSRRTAPCSCTSTDKRRTA
ncbi:MAG: hypothetical protein IKG94_03070 [Candidatus Methanomethylophilaceae archaeon]|nr:hypothetical protein [Candidatus Methanomethylophilaceae archaeon]